MPYESDHLESTLRHYVTTANGAWHVSFVYPCTEREKTPKTHLLDGSTGQRPDGECNARPCLSTDDETMTPMVTRVTTRVVFLHFTEIPFTGATCCTGVKATGGKCSWRQLTVLRTLTATTMAVTVHRSIYYTPVML